MKLWRRRPRWWARAPRIATGEPQEKLPPPNPSKGDSLHGQHRGDPKTQSSLGADHRNDKEMDMHSLPSNGQTRHEISLHELFLEGRLGRGAFGSVYKASHSMSGWLCAVKVMKMNAMLVEHYKTEVATLESCNHPFVLKLLSAKQSVLEIYLVTELISGVD